MDIFIPHAVGVDSWVQRALKSILRETVFGSASYFFSILKFIFTPFLEFKISEKSHILIDNLVKKLAVTKLDSRVNYDSLTSTA